MLPPAGDDAVPAAAEPRPAAPEGPTGLGDPEIRHRLVLAEAELEDLRAHLQGSEWMASHIEELEAAQARLEAQVGALGSAPGTVGGPLPRSLVRRAAGRVRRLVAGQPPGQAPGTVEEDGGEVPAPASFPEDRRYPSWVALYDTVDDAARAAIASRLAAMADPPLVSVILPVYNTPERYLREALDSVRAQIYQHWELCVVDDCSTAAWVPKVLEEYAALDRRIRVTRRELNGHISEASNTAVGMATGEWIALFDHDDLLAVHALALAVLAVAATPDAGALYSDEDHIDDEGHRSAPYFKPDYDPLLLCGQNYFSHLCMIRRDLVERAGAYRTGYEGSQDWDLVLRVVELLRPEQVVHVPHVLYHWRVHPGSTASSLAAKPYAATAARRAVAGHLERTGRAGAVLPVGESSFTRVRWDLPDQPPPVTVIILPRSGARLARCIDSVRALATYPELRVVVVDDGGRWPNLRRFMADRGASVHVVEDRRGLSDGDLLNAAAASVEDGVLCFLHDDVEALSDGWLEEMVGLLLQPGVGAVGAKLLYPDGSVQHAGMVMGIGGTVGYVHRGFDRLDPGYFGRAMLSQSFSAVSWACMVVRREAFRDVGGFDTEHLSDAFLDVDLCLRLGQAGWRVAWTPYAQLLHHESPTGPRETEGENAVRFAREIRHLQTRWRDVADHDPAYNPNLSLAHETWPLAWPPRTSYR